MVEVRDLRKNGDDTDDKEREEIWAILDDVIDGKYLSKEEFLKQFLGDLP